jgi:hypothetical protein
VGEVAVGERVAAEAGVVVEEEAAEQEAGEQGPEVSVLVFVGLGHLFG